MYRQIAILSVLICFLATPALAAQMSVEPAYQEAFQGDNITVNITVDPEGSEVYGASYILYFNNTVLNATSQVKGPFLTQDGAGSIIYIPPTGINNSIGQVEYVETRSGTYDGVYGAGVLTTITFQVIGEEGTSSLNIGDSDGLLLCTCPPLVEAIPTTVNNGGVEVRDWVCGDVTGEGNVNMGDVTKLLWNQTYWGQYPVDPGAADVTGEGDVNMGDVTKLLWNQTYWGQYSLTCC